MQADSQVRSDRQAAERAGVPPKDWEAEVLQAFIRNRLFECQKRVRPFWNLNGLMTSNHGRPYLFTVLATDEHAYRLAEASLGIRGVLERTSELLQAGTPKWLPGRDRIVLYSREGVAPLFYLNEWELKQMRDSSSQKEREKFLYVDRRFEDVVEKVVRPAETAEETAAYAIGIGLALGIVKHGELGDDPYPDLLFELEGEGVSFANLCSAIDAVVRHAELRHALYDLDDSAMAEKNDNKRSETQHEALQYAHQMVKQVKATTKLPRTSEEEDCWRMVERTILQRINYGLPFVRG